MANITNDTGSLWKTDSSAATTTEVIVEVVSDMSFTDGTQEATPDGATVALETVAGDLGYFDFDTQGELDTARQAGSLKEYWRTMWVKYLPDGTLTLADDNLNLMTLSDTNTTTGRSRCRFRSIFRDTTDAPELQTGFRCYVEKVTNGTAYTQREGFPAVSYNHWFLVDVLVESTSPGRLAMFIGGVMIGEWHGVDLTFATAAMTAPDIRFSMNMGANVHVKSHNGPTLLTQSGDRTRLAPRWNLVPARSSLTKFLFHNRRKVTAADHGRHWYYTDAGGATSALTDYHPGLPSELRVVVSHTGVSGSTTVTGTENIGTLPFRALDGWSTVVLKDYLHVLGADFTLQLRNTADDDDVCLLTVDGTNTLTGGADSLWLNGTDTGIDITATRNTIAIHMHEGGGCRVTVIDNSGDATSRMVWSAVGGVWTVGTVGKPIMISTHDAISTVDIGNIAVCETWEVGGLDSLVHVATTGPTPDYARANHLSRAFVVQDIQSFPGGFYPMKNEWDAIGEGRRQLATILGRSGTSQATMYTNALTHLTETRGMRLWMLDVSVNDTSGFTTVTDAATAASEAARINADTDTILSELVPNNEVLIGTVVERTALTHWIANTAACEAFVTALNAGVLALAKKHQSGGRITYSDTTSASYSTSDSVHPTNAESYNYGVALIANITTPPGSGMRNRIARGVRRSINSPTR